MQSIIKRFFIKYEWIQGVDETFSIYTMINYFVKFLAFIMFSFVLIKVPKKHDSIGVNLI